MKLINKIAYRSIELIDKYIHKRKIIFYLEKILKKPKYIIDVGAHKGSYTDLFLIFNKNLKLVLFEPYIYLYEKLLKKYKNKKNLKIFNNGIGEKNSKKKFLLNKNSDYISSFSKINNQSKYLFIRNLVLGSFKNKIEEKKVNVKKLDSFQYLKKKKIDLIKVDVEGYEEQVIDGGKIILRKTKILLIEFHKDDIYKNFNYKRLHKKILKLGFKLHKTIKFPLMKWEDRIYTR